MKVKVKHPNKIHLSFGLAIERKYKQERCTVSQLVSKPGFKILM